jgi:farnesyl-diphosphate farnesyltransferase
MSVEIHNRNDEEFIDALLQGTSRTFALAIPLLAAERRRQIGLSYLLFRVADCIEDAPEGDAALKKELLTKLNAYFLAPNVSHRKDSELALSDSTGFASLWPEQSPNSGLLLGLPRLMDIFSRLPPSVSQVIGTAVRSTIMGMVGFIDASINSPNQIQIQTLDHLRLYCYAVAGVVGEMLTDIFVDHFPPGLADHKELRRLSVGFGEFLQLINILKDSHLDACSGRVFIPIEVSRETIHELALEGRRDACHYIQLLEKSHFPADIIHFCRFIYLLADGSLVKVRDEGAGSKLTRGEVLQILSDVRSEDFSTSHP